MPWHSSMEKYIHSQLKHWHQQREKINFPQLKQEHEPKAPTTVELPFITISREYGCHGYDVASILVDKLNKDLKIQPEWAAYDKKLLDDLVQDLGLSESLTETLSSDARSSLTNILQTSFSKHPSQVTIYRKLAKMISILAANGHVILVGRAGNYITRSFERGYHIRLVASRDFRITNIQKIYDISRAKAAKMVKQNSKRREHFILKFVKHDITDPLNYHLVINLSRHSIDETAEIIIAGLKAKNLLVTSKPAKEK